MTRSIQRLAIIPARGGSRRLPRKNVVEFEGRPIIAWTIDAARESECFERIVVSTDDPEIAHAARAAGAEVQDRPPSLAGASATVAQVCLHVLAGEESMGRQYDILCCLYPTAPLRHAEDVRSTVGLIEPGVCDFALAVTEYSHPPHQALRRGADDTLAPMWPELVAEREDTLGSLVVDNGSTYAATVAAFQSYGTFYGPGLRGHLMSRARSVDIDRAEDLELARHYAQRLGL